MTKMPTFDDAILKLKNAVAPSTIQNQNHIDLTLVNAPDRMEYQKALMVVQSAVCRGEISQIEVNEQLGL